MLALEYIAKFIIAIIAIILIVGLVGRILNVNSLCFFPFCEEKSNEINTRIVRENRIDESVMKKYCKLCWDKTGKVDYKTDALCYVVLGDYAPISPDLEEYCEFRCGRLDHATAILFEFSSINGKIIIEC